VVGTASTRRKRKERAKVKKVDQQRGRVRRTGGRGRERWDVHIRAVRVRRENGGPKPRSTFVEAELFPELEALLCTESASLD
jgi:hypothetical protein